MNITKIYIKHVFVVFAAVIFLSCQDEIDNPDPDPNDTISGKISQVDSLVYNRGILLYNADQRKKFWTEFNTQMLPYHNGNARSNLRLETYNENPFMEVSAEGGAGSFGLRMSFFKTLSGSHVLPGNVSSRITGLRFSTHGYQDNELTVMVLDVNGNVIANKSFELKPMVIKTCEVAFSNPLAKEVLFFTNSGGTGTAHMFGIDDVLFITPDNEKFAPPTSDNELLGWLKATAFNFFEWNYLDLPGEWGAVSESYTESSIITLSGIGYAYAIYIIAANDGLIGADLAKERIKRMLQWQVDQDWFDGSGGWHGFPHHYFKPDGTFFWDDVSTIDWAMCAAGIRVVRQYYHNDPEIVAMADELLSRPDWSAALAEDNKIAMGFEADTGEMNSYRWGLAFSEETELVYLEAVASGGLDISVFDGIERIPKMGFYPSWFGAGFTYNWLQLWTGVIEPYKSNSIVAYENDATTCLAVFDRPLMGLTACSTVRDVDDNNFLNWSRYISNQGGYIHGASSNVIQISPAPYGAALALPFTYDLAISALKEYINMGYYHEYLGLPDNIRIKNLIDGMGISPNWDPFDINIGPIILSIEQIQNNSISTLYLNDEDISNALEALIASWPE
jgi:hypothetical protein